MEEAKTIRAPDRWIWSRNPLFDIQWVLYRVKSR
jgi:hypothetical protein